MQCTVKVAPPCSPLLHALGLRRLQVAAAAAAARTHLVLARAEKVAAPDAGHQLQARGRVRAAAVLLVPRLHAQGGRRSKGAGVGPQPLRGRGVRQPPVAVRCNGEATLDAVACRHGRKAVGGRALRADRGGRVARRDGCDVMESPSRQMSTRQDRQGGGAGKAHAGHAPSPARTCLPTLLTARPWPAPWQLPGLPIRSAAGAVVAWRSRTRSSDVYGKPAAVRAGRGVVAERVRDQHQHTVQQSSWPRACNRDRKSVV